MALTRRASLLLVVWIRAATAFLQPPVNVTLHCQNLNNTLRWEYSGETPGLKYRVDIHAYYDSNADGFQNFTWVEPRAQEADLSFLSDPSEAYFLTVTAVLGDNESDPSPSEEGITFSYSKDFDVQHKCFVDLPPVTLTAQPHNRVKLSFQHPWLPLYQKQLSSRKLKARRKKSHDEDMSEPLPVFEYEVELLNQKQEHHSFFCDEEVCEELVPVDPAQERHCLLIRGDLEQTLVKGTQEFCEQPFQMVQGSSYNNKYIYAVVFSLVAAVVFIAVMVIYKKTWVSSRTLSSKGMNFNNLGPERPTQPVADVISQIRVEPKSSTETETSTESSPVVHSEREFLLTLGVPPAGDDVPDVEGEDVPDAEGEDVPDAQGESEDGAAYMSGSGLEEGMGYERREMVVCLGDDDDDVARGYRGNAPSGV